MFRSTRIDDFEKNRLERNSEKQKARDQRDYDSLISERKDSSGRCLRNLKEVLPKRRDTLELLREDSVLNGYVEEFGKIVLSYFDERHNKEAGRLRGRVFDYRERVRRVLDDNPGYSRVFASALGFESDSESDSGLSTEELSKLFGDLIFEITFRTRLIDRDTANENTARKILERYLLF